ncbi:unnamed protein product [Arctogadus glacialis]
MSFSKQRRDTYGATLTTITTTSQPPFITIFCPPTYPPPPPSDHHHNNFETTISTTTPTLPPPPPFKPHLTISTTTIPNSPQHHPITITATATSMDLSKLPIVSYRLHHIPTKLEIPLKSRRHLQGPSVRPRGQPPCGLDRVQAQQNPRRCSSRCLTSFSTEQSWEREALLLTKAM